MNESAAPVEEAVDVAKLPSPNGAPEVAPDEVDKNDLFDFDFGRLIINLFIIFHVTAIVIWNLPSTPLQQNLFNVVKGYMALTGSWQAWSMFSPDPVNQDIYLGAVIHYKDGSTRQYTFPRIAKLSIFGKYRFERWRKVIENTQPVNNSPTWPYLARYAALQNNPNPKTNPPVSVDLYRFQRFIATEDNPPLRYLREKMMTEDVFAMPSKGPLHLGN